MKKGDEKELERNLRLENVVASKQHSLAVEMDEEKRAKLEMNQLPNGSGWPWRQTKKERKTREVVAVQVGPGDRGRKKSKKKRNGFDLDLI